MFKIIKSGIFLFIVLICLSGIATATNYTIYNGDFETGDLSGWVVDEDGQNR